MTNTKSQSMMAKTITEAVEDLEKSIGVEPGFHKSIVKEDDWSFIIKLHALIEAALTHLLVKILNDERLISVVSNLEMSNIRTGKIAFTKALDALDKKHRRFVSQLSDLRNDLVHDISRINFNLKEHVNGMDKQQKKSFVIGFGCIDKDETLSGDLVNAYLKTPNHVILMGAMSLLTSLYVEKLLAETRNILQNTSIGLVTKLVSKETPLSETESKD